MIRSKRIVVGCIVACLAVVGIASSASAQVLAGQVGSGIHMEYGPQNAGARSVARRKGDPQPSQHKSCFFREHVLQYCTVSREEQLQIY